MGPRPLIYGDSLRFRGRPQVARPERRSRLGVRDEVVGRLRLPALAAELAERAVPDPEQPAGGDEHDHEEDDPDDRVERPAEQRAAETDAGHVEVADVVLDHDERERAEPRALDP